MDILIKLSRASSIAVTVQYETRDDTALAGLDYTATSGTISFAPGEISKPVSIDILVRDTSNTRQFLLVVTAVTGATISDSTGLCMIIPVNANGPLIMTGLITNAYNSVNGRGDYFHYNSGTSEGQFIAIEGALRAAKVMMAGDADDQYKAEWMRMLGITLINGMGSGSLNGPIIRQPFPASDNTIFLPHWLFAAKGDVPKQNGKYDYTGNVTNGKIIIPRKDIFNVWKIYPVDATLLYQNPYSPAYDASGNDVSVAISDWVINGNNTEITIPPGAPALMQWKVMFGYNNGMIKQGQAFEAYPFWTPIPDGYSACAPDTFRWFELALAQYMVIDTSDFWATPRAAAKKSAIKGQNISDLRQVLKPYPGLPVFPTTGNPDGMFCYSTHAQAASGNGGAGSNFWSRMADGNIQGDVPPGNLPAQTQIGRGFNDSWRQQTSYQDADGYLWLELSCSQLLNSNGYKVPKTLTITIKKVTDGYELTAFGKTVTVNVIDGDLLAGMYGTGEPFVSSAADKDGTYGHFVIQTAGYCQYTLNTANADVSALATNATLTETLAYNVEYDGLIYVFVSSSKNYDANKRWYAELKDLAAWADVVTKFNAGQFVDFYIPNTLFKRKDSDDAILPIGTGLENFGISIEHPGGYTVRIGNMRMVKDQTAAAKKGAKMPYFPGSMPFAINADTVNQQYVGWNGSPFHGYQLPDYWSALGPQADQLYPNLVASDLIVADPSTGVLSAPISPTDTAGYAKPKAALLMEQQLLFLKHAQQRWVIDGGDTGPFAHTFVLNTPARMALGNPTPHTWVYTNDDPNTRWSGYQVRVVESLARLTYISRFTTGYKTATDLAATMALSWLSWLDAAWPNLNSGTIHGMPTDFPDPHTGKPVANYEEPHAPAVILRACLWLKIAKRGQTALLDGIISRCWDYLESLWLTSGPMRYTWCANPDDGEWFGFWHFEIVTTLAVMLDEAKSVRPSTITEDVIRERLRLTATWLKETGVE